MEKEVDGYSLKYFALPPSERRRRWEELTVECQGVQPAFRRLQRLERGLDIVDPKFVEPVSGTTPFSWLVVRHFLGRAEERAAVLSYLRRDLGLDPSRTVANVAFNPWMAELEPRIVSDALDYPMLQARAEANKTARTARDRPEEKIGFSFMFGVFGVVGLIALVAAFSDEAKRTQSSPPPSFQYVTPSEEEATFQSASLQLGEQFGAERVHALRLHLGDALDSSVMKILFAEYFYRSAESMAIITDRGLLGRGTPPDESEVYLAAACAVYRDVCCDEEKSGLSQSHASRLAEILRAYLQHMRHSSTSNDSVDVSPVQSQLSEESVAMPQLLKALQTAYAAAGRYVEWRETFDARVRRAENDPHALIGLAMERATEPEPVQGTKSPAVATGELPPAETGVAIHVNPLRLDARSRDVLKLLGMAVRSGFAGAKRLRESPALQNFLSLPAFQGLVDRTATPTNEAVE
ncbi:MAG: hypothetical protein C0485_03560 [Pirellula sp.]|nr:hypothetical protein [Pirellula sp.]